MSAMTAEQLAEIKTYQTQRVDTGDLGRNLDAEDILELVAEVERLQAENARMRAALAECRKIAVSWLTCVDRGWNEIMDIRDVADRALEAEQ